LKVRLASGIFFRLILASITGSTRCLAIENTALEPPRIEVIVADAVVNRAEIETNFRRKILLVATASASSSAVTLIPTSRLFVSDASFMPLRFISVRTGGIATATINVIF